MKRLPKNYKDIKLNKFKFPMGLLKSVDECSNGFVLFAINLEGDIEVFNNLTNSVAATAIANKAVAFGSSILQIEGQNTFNDLTGQNGDDDCPHHDHD